MTRWVVLAVVVAACGRVGFGGFHGPSGDGGPDDGSQRDPDATGAGDDAPDPDASTLADAAPDAAIDGPMTMMVDAAMVLCGDIDLGSAMGVVFNSATASQGDDYSGCGGATQPDHALEWTAPTTKSYTFDLCLSSGNFDSVLSVLDGTCNGAMLGCADSGCSDENASVTVSLTGGQHVVIVVDGNSSPKMGFFGNGTYQLRIQ